VFSVVAAVSWSDVGTEEVDREACRALRLDVVLDIGWDPLGTLPVDDYVGHRVGVGNEPKCAFGYPEAPPCSGRYPVRAPESIRHRVFIPCGCRSNHGEVGRDLAAITERTLQRRADALRTLRLVVDPWRHPKRRSVPNVLTVMALE
jgi:hypothetical protein